MLGAISMIQLNYRSFELELKHTFTIARGSVDQQPTFIVEVAQGNCFGYGEATTNHFYGATLESFADATERVRPLIENTDVEDLNKLLPRLDEELSGTTADRFALCALDLALHDLWGKRQGKPLHELWGFSSDNAPLSNFTIGIDSPEKMVAKMGEAGDWPIFKIKLGTKHDIEIVTELRRHTQAIFRVDANCGWTAFQTIENSIALKELGVEFIEQPLAMNDLEGARQVFDESALPIIADESCVVESDVELCSQLFHGINIKLVKCGGIAPALRMINRGKALGLKTMVGCMTESTVGISAIAQLAPLLDYVDMDGAALLASDIATGAHVDHGRCIYPKAPGSGVALHCGTFSS